MKWEPVDVIVGILAGTILVFLLLVAVEQLLTEGGVTPDKVKIINAIVVTCLGVIGVYVGNRMNKNTKP